MDEIDAKELLTVEQAAQFLQLSQSSIRTYIRQGKLKAYRVAGSRRVLIPKAQLIALLEPATNQSTKKSKPTEEHS